MEFEVDEMALHPVKLSHLTARLIALSSAMPCEYQSCCFYNIAYIQPNAPLVCHFFDKSNHKLGIGLAYVAMLDLNISV